MRALTHADISQTLEDLDRQHAQTLANLQAIEGARQLARQLIARIASPDSTLSKSKDGSLSVQEAGVDDDSETAGATLPA